MKSATFRPIVRPFTGRSLLVFVVLVCIAGVAMRIVWHILPWSVRNFMAPGAISVIHAIYGGTCGAAEVTFIAAEHCEGRYSCDMSLERIVTGQGAKTCAANFGITWVCGRTPGTKFALIANPAPSAIASITCPTTATGDVK
jgi:hypothetical protein